MVPYLEMGGSNGFLFGRSEEHTSELQSLTNLVCRLLLEKKKKPKINDNTRLSRDNRKLQSILLTNLV